MALLPSKTDVKPEAAVSIRLATPVDLEELVALSQRAYMKDPVHGFLGDLHAPLSRDSTRVGGRKNQMKYFRYLFRRAWALGWRVTVVTVDQKIVATTIWRPPATECKPVSKMTSIRAGLLSVIFSWGPGAISRILEVTEPTAASIKRGLNERQLSLRLDEVWYLQTAATDPIYQDKGYMTMLMHEAFEHVPGAVFALEATTPPARDRFTHWGFETVEDITIGKGRVNIAGIAAEQGLATGIYVFPMVRAPKKDDSKK
ncbi:hypothetical protein FISHEDRAFT_69600 [Fistulina hepatica ATCC 64428]|uniref:N-acetyltransferase domain-containing protein n=1 Tax=Fistulina hepatica ATCC 64428 TaxID=1128425 RepID=A0A0D7ALQ2_9AGAR|nr:hypothetical protein FISHEDRAFT_69600 [Fistulina hepatica ATCC 64428]